MWDRVRVGFCDMTSGNDEVYELNEPPIPVAPIPATPVQAASSATPTLGYQSTHVARRELELRPVEATLPSWKLPAILIAVGALLLYGPLLWASPTFGGFIVATSYVAVRFAMMLVATLALAYLINISFGAGGSYLLRLLAIVLIADGTPLAMIWLLPVCVIVPLALLTSFGITCYLFNLLFELELPENMYAALAYWLPGIAGFLLVARMTSWLAGWFL